MLQNFFHLNGNNGELISTFENETLSDFQKFEKIGDYYCGLSEDGLIRVNEEGEIYDTVSSISNVRQFFKKDDDIFVLTKDNFLKKTNLDFEEQNVYSNFAGTTRKVKIIENTVQVFSVGEENNFFITTLTSQLEFVSEKEFNIPEGQSTTPLNYYDFNMNQVGIGVNHQLAMPAAAVRYLQYSTQDEEDAIIERVDVELSDLDIYHYEIESTTAVPDYIEEDMYKVKIFAKGLLKNHSDYILNSCYLNHHMGPNFASPCGDGYSVYHNLFENLNILPGESKWVDLGVIHHNTEALQLSGDSIMFDLCAFTSTTNGIADLKISNDKSCKTIYLGTLGLEDNTLNKKAKKVVKVVNLLGQEVKPEPNKLLIYIFEDGTSEKRILTE